MSALDWYAVPPVSYGKLKQHTQSIDEWLLKLVSGHEVDISISYWLHKFVVIKMTPFSIFSLKHLHTFYNYYF